MVPGLIPEGLSLLAGRPKIGKSWLAWISLYRSPRVTTVLEIIRRKKVTCFIARSRTTSVD